METQKLSGKYYWRSWYAEHKNTRQQYLRDYYQKRRETMLEQAKKRMKRYYQRHREKIRARDRVRQGTEEYRQKRNARERAKRELGRVIH